MERIKINTGKIKDISTNITHNSNNIKEVKYRFDTVKGDIDYRILKRRNIQSRLDIASGSVNKIHQDLKQLGLFLEVASNKYDQTENLLEKMAKAKFPEGNYWELIKAVTGGISFYQGSKLNLKLGDLKFDFEEINGRTFLKLNGGNPRDYNKYRDLLIARFGGSPSLWKKSFFEQLLTKGIPLYDEENRFKFNNSSSYRMNMRRFGTNQLDNLSQYISRLGESKFKAFLKNTGDGIMSTFTDFNVFKYKSVTQGSSKMLGVVGTGITVFENFQEAYGENGLNKKQFAIDMSVDVVSGASATALGAAIGSLFFPPVGTVVGAGAVIVSNFVLNAKIIYGKSIVDITKNYFNNPEETKKEIKEDINKFVDSYNNTANEIGKKLNEIF